MKLNRKNLFQIFQIWKRSRVVKTTKSPPLWIGAFRHWVYGFALLSLFFIIFESGMQWRLPSFIRTISLIVDYIVILLFILDAFLTFYYSVPKQDYFRKNWMDILVLLPIVMHLIPVRTITGLVIFRYFIVLFKIFTRSRKFSGILRKIRLNTAQIIAISFIITISIGTILLTFPTATADGLGTPFLDAVFTATSATCVTGLIVRDTPTYFSQFGQIVILILIQLGGLGIMTYSAFVAIIIGRFTLDQRKLIQEMFEEERNVYNTILYIFKMTITIELAGALLLFLRWHFYFRDTGKTIYFSIFHAVSAFCNAGFSLFSDSLVRFASDPFTNITIGSLIVAGGIGFIVVYEVSNLIRGRRRTLSPHSKLVLSTSLALLLIGFISIFYLEFDGVLIHQSFISKVFSSMFQSITARTAGFNTVPVNALKEVTLSVLIVLMFIGASPGSTGGGIKTSTFAVLFLSVRSIIRGDARISAFNRTIPNHQIRKAIALLILAISLIFLVFMILLMTEKKPYVQLLFEATSAFGTVGLSTGITPDLSNSGKMLIIILMYMGRIGPLTMGLALTREMIKGRIDYPEARILIG